MKTAIIIKGIFRQILQTWFEFGAQTPHTSSYKVER